MADINLNNSQQPMPNIYRRRSSDLEHASTLESNKSSKSYKSLLITFIILSTLNIIFSVFIYFKLLNKNNQSTNNDKIIDLERDFLELKISLMNNMTFVGNYIDNQKVLNRKYIKILNNNEEKINCIYQKNELLENDFMKLKNEYTNSTDLFNNNVNDLGQRYKNLKQSIDNNISQII